MKKLILVTAVLVLLCMAGIAQATLLTFDDIDTGGNIVAVSSGYQGFDWSNFYAAGKDYLQAVYGNGNAVVSPENAIFNGYGASASMVLSSSSSFDLNSAWCTNWAQSGYGDLTVNGYLGSTLVGTSVTALSDVPTFVTFGLSGIDSAVFSRSGSSNWFLMDDVTVNANAVPEPATLLGFGIPMLMVGIGKLRGIRK